MEKVLVIVGPTAVGKTALSVELAKNSMERSLVETLCKSIKNLILELQKSVLQR